MSTLLLSALVAVALALFQQRRADRHAEIRVAMVQLQRYVEERDVP